MTGAEAPVVPLPAAPDTGRSRGRPGRHLRPVERPRTRRSPAVPVLVGAGIVVIALFALAAMHALLINRQIRLDDLRQDAAAEAEEVRRLRLEVAELEAPDRILDVARTRLDMVDPTEVGYLLPTSVEIGETDPMRVAPAEAPAPEAEGDGGDEADGTVAETVSPEQQEVEATDQSGAVPGTDTSTDTGTDTDTTTGAGAEGGPEERAE